MREAPVLGFEEDGTISANLTLQESGIPVQIIASNIDKQRTGVFAQIELYLGPNRAAHSYLNVSRDGDRRLLARSAYMSLSDVAQGQVGRQALKRILDDFCYPLWDTYVGRIEIESMAGGLASPGPRPLLEPYILYEAGTALFAPPKRGKSFTALGMAVTADAGLTGSPFGCAREPAKVLYINLERSRDSMELRLAQMNVALGLKADRPLDFLNQRGSTLADIKDRVRRGVRENGYRLIVYDSISRSGYGTLTADDNANRIFDTLNGFGIAYLAIGHTPRGDETHLFGSQMQSAAVDMEISLLTDREHETGKLGVALKVVSANDVAYPPTRLLAYEFDERGLTTVRLAPPAEFASLDAGKRTQIKRIEDHLAETGSATASEISQDLHIHRPTVVEKLKDPRFVKLPRQGRRVPYGLRSVTPDMSPLTDGDLVDVSSETPP